MFDFQQLEVYKKAKAFHIEMQQIIRLASLDRIISDQSFYSL